MIPKLRMALPALLTCAVLATALLFGLLAGPAQAGSSCTRTPWFMDCEVEYYVSPKSKRTMTFVINNLSNAVGVSAQGRAWLEGTNDTSLRTRVGPIWKHVPNRFRFKLWRACVSDYRPWVKVVCTGWAWQGPR